MDSNENRSGSLAPQLAGAIISIIADVSATVVPPLRELLPLPEELVVRANLCAGALIVGAPTIVIILQNGFRERRFDPYPHTSNLVAIFVSIAVLFGFVISFYAAEWWWKHTASEEMANFIYGVIEPAVYGGVFGSIAVFGTYAYQLYLNSKRVH